MPAVFEYDLTVPASAIDALGHANNTVYLQWMEAAATAHSTAQGWTTARYLDQGVAWVARSHHIEYRRPARQDDALVVRTWVATMEKVASLRMYRIERRLDDAGLSQFELLARAETRWVLIDLATGRPLRIPPVIADSFELASLANSR